MRLYYAEQSGPVNIKPRSFISATEAKRFFLSVYGERLLIIYHESETKDATPFIIDWEKTQDGQSELLV